MYADQKFRPLSIEAVTLLQEGRFVDAIKVVRQSEGLGLKDAKDRVEYLRKPASQCGSGDRRWVRSEHLRRNRQSHDQKCNQPRQAGPADPRHRRSPPPRGRPLRADDQPTVRAEGAYSRSTCVRQRRQVVRQPVVHTS